MKRNPSLTFGFIIVFCLFATYGMAQQIQKEKRTRADYENLAKQRNINYPDRTVNLDDSYTMATHLETKATDMTKRLSEATQASHSEYYQILEINRQAIQMAEDIREKYCDDEATLNKELAEIAAFRDKKLIRELPKTKRALLTNLLKSGDATKTVSVVDIYDF